MRSNKAVIENVLSIEVRKDVAEKPIRQLNEVLKLIGQRVDKLPGRKKRGTTITYRYRLNADRVDAMEALFGRRKRSRPWHTLYSLHGWDPSGLDPWYENDE